MSIISFWDIVLCSLFAIDTFQRFHHPDDGSSTYSEMSVCFATTWHSVPESYLQFYCSHLMQSHYYKPCECLNCVRSLNMYVGLSHASVLN
jgi:hypothetical protein